MTEVERWWFRMHAAHTDMPFPYDPDQTGRDFEALDHADAAASLEASKQEIAHARAAVAGKQLDDVVPSHGHHPERTRDIRWIYLHMNRGVRAPQRPRRPAPGADRRRYRYLTPVARIKRCPHSCRSRRQAGSS